MIDPMASFEVKTLIPLELFGIDISITNSSLYMIVVVLVVCALFFIGTSDKAIIPNKLRYCLESLFKFINGIIDSNVSEKGSQLFPYILSLFLFITVGNMIGLLPYAFSFTSQLVVTLCMACLVFISSIIVGFCNQGMHYLKHFCPDGIPTYIAPFFVIIELMSFAFRPISLGIRLFANMVSGHIMIKIIASFAVSLASLSFLSGGLAIIPVIVNVLLNVFKLVVCVLQAYVFAVLSCIYLSESLTVENKERRK